MSQVQTATPPQAPPRAKSPRPLFRALAVTVAGLWFLFLTNLGLSIAQRFGQALGAPIVAAAPVLLIWVRQQPILVQIALAALLVYFTAFIIWLSVWLWRFKVQAQLEDEMATLAEEEAKLQRGLAPLDAKVARVAEDMTDARTEAVELAQAAEKRDADLAEAVQAGHQELREQTQAIRVS